MHKKKLLIVLLIIGLSFIMFYGIKELIFYRKVLNSCFNRSYVNLQRRSRDICNRINKTKDNFSEDDVQYIYSNFVEIQEELSNLGMYTNEKSKKNYSNYYVVQLSNKLNLCINNKDYTHEETRKIIDEVYNTCKKISEVLDGEKLDNTLKGNLWETLYENINNSIEK